MVALAKAAAASVWPARPETDMEGGLRLHGVGALWRLRAVPLPGQGRQRALVVSDGTAAGPPRPGRPAGERDTALLRARLLRHGVFALLIDQQGVHSDPQGPRQRVDNEDIGVPDAPGRAAARPSAAARSTTCATRSRRSASARLPAATPSTDPARCSASPAAARSTSLAPAANGARRSIHSARALTSCRTGAGM